MVTFLSITGLFRTALMLIGAFVLLRFFGQLMQSRRDAEIERREDAAKKMFEKEKAEKQRNLGKTKIVNSNQTTANTQDVDFEEVKD